MKVLYLLIPDRCELRMKHSVTEITMSQSAAAIPWTAVVVYTMRGSSMLASHKSKIK